MAATAFYQPAAMAAGVDSRVHWRAMHHHWCVAMWSFNMAQLHLQKIHLWQQLQHQNAIILYQRANRLLARGRPSAKCTDNVAGVSGDAEEECKHSTNLPQQQQHTRDGQEDLAPPTDPDLTDSTPNLLSHPTSSVEECTEEEASTSPTLSPEESADDEGTSTPPVLRMLRTRKGLDPTPHLLRPLFPEPTPIGTPFTRPTQFELRSLDAFKESLFRAVAEAGQDPSSTLNEDEDDHDFFSGYVTSDGGWQEYAHEYDHDYEDEYDYEEPGYDKHHSDEPEVKPPRCLAFQLPTIGEGVLYQPYDSLSDTDEENVTDPHDFQLHKYNKDHWFPEDRPYDPRYDTNSDQWDCAMYHDLRDAAVADHLASL